MKGFFSQKMWQDMGQELIAKVGVFERLLNEALDEYPSEPSLLGLAGLVAKAKERASQVGELNIRAIAQDICVVDGMIISLRYLAMDLLEKSFQPAEATAEEAVEPHH